MTSEEKMHEEMTDLIYRSRDKFIEFKDEAEKLVRRAQAFAGDTIEYTTDAQDDDEELQGMDGEILEEWRHTNKRMEACIKQADTVQALCNRGFDKLRSAQGKAAAGRVRGMQKKHDSAGTAGLCLGGAGALACLGVAATGPVGFAFLAGSFLLEGGALASISDSKKHAEWEKKFANEEWKLDQVYSLLISLTDSMKQELTGLYVESTEILDKASRIADRSRLSRSSYFKLRCRRLGEQSARLKRNCGLYITNVHHGFEITGAMNQLSIAN
ncbi:uncharacterized protein LOC144909543 [Branchiostoma floridae x Branchiostoma belcheri]